MPNIVVVWRGKQYNVEINPNSTIKEFGEKLQTLTNVKPDTMRLLLPRSSDKGSKLLTPFSDEHSNLSLQETSVLEGKPIRMMGVFDDEVEEVLRNSTKDMRIAGFDEEQKRLKQRLLGRPHTSLKLPQGSYIFCDFRTLHIPGIELNPPASQALKIMHMLACDPGIIAIMNKHRWRVGIMTEMAPVGYVGISPKCILGFNKNHGEEISLRLRTDDLKGFRKYESIKKTLLHELAHMVYSEHDSNFYALDKQLNHEASNLNWTKSRGHTLSGSGRSDRYEEEFEFDVGTGNVTQKLGGRTLNSSIDARTSSVAAAYHRLLHASTNGSLGVKVQAESIHTDGKVSHEEPDPDDGMENNGNLEHKNLSEPEFGDSCTNEDVVLRTIYSKPSVSSGYKKCIEHNPKALLDDEIMSEPDHDDSHICEAMDSEPHLNLNKKFCAPKSCEEPDPDDSGSNNLVEPDPDDSMVVQSTENVLHSKLARYPFPQKRSEKAPYLDDCREKEANVESGKFAKLDNDDPQANNIILAEPDPDDCMGEKSDVQTDEFNPSDGKIVSATSVINMGSCRSETAFEAENQVLARIDDHVAVICARLQKAIEVLRLEVTPAESKSVLQTLLKIIRNVIEHPDEMKFRRLRKANPLFQKNVANYKAAIEVLYVVGFQEDIVWDEIGRAETYMVLKRDDPGLLWLAKSSLEMCSA